LWLTLAIGAPVPAQTVANDDTILKQVIVFGRQGVRAPTPSPAAYAVYSPRPYPDFGAPPGYLTVHGQQAATLLGAYFRQYLLGASAEVSRRGFVLGQVGHFRADRMHLDAPTRELADLHREWRRVCLACLLPAEPRLQPSDLRKLGSIR
jgi:hypothetical protein